MTYVKTLPAKASYLNAVFIKTLTKTPTKPVSFSSLVSTSLFYCGTFWKAYEHKPEKHSRSSLNKTLLNISERTPDCW